MVETKSLSGKRWAELLDPEDSLSIMDERGDTACKVTRGRHGRLVFEFRENVGFIGNDMAEVPLLPTPEAWGHAAVERARLLGLFEGPIFAEEIPNGYCGPQCCFHRKWFIVTTRIGHIKIGWRKRVISIDWERTLVTKTAEELFPKEEVTKRGRLIHAYGYEKAKEYIDRLHAKELAC